MLLVRIRRANLDAFWGREPSTVMRNRQIYERTAESAISMDIEVDLFESMGPFPIKDNQGMAQACMIFQRSLDSGKNEQYVQFSTVRKCGQCSSTCGRSQ